MTHVVDCGLGYIAHCALLLPQLGYVECVFVLLVVGQGPFKDTLGPDPLVKRVFGGVFCFNQVCF